MDARGLARIYRIFFSGSDMNRSTEIWTLCVGRWRGVEVRLHYHFPLLVLVVLLFATTNDRFGASLAALTLAILLVSTLLHELAKALSAARVGGHTDTLILSPTGGYTTPHLPDDPPAHLVTALAGPICHLALMVLGGCVLALHGDRDLLGLLHPFSPALSASAGPLVHACQVVVWLNWCLLLINLLPITPCDGAELFRGILWPIVGRTTATAATANLALGISLLMALAAVVFRQQMLVEQIPAWFPLGIASVVLFYGGVRDSVVRRYDLGLAIDEYESDDQQWQADQWMAEEYEAVLVEYQPDKQQETIDRKRREQEAHEDARVDAILARLQSISFEQLSEEDRAILKRASRRYRERRQSQ